MNHRDYCDDTLMNTLTNSSTLVAFTIRLLHRVVNLSRQLAASFNHLKLSTGLLNRFILMQFSTLQLLKCTQPE